MALIVRIQLGGFPWGLMAKIVNAGERAKTHKSPRESCKSLATSRANSVCSMNYLRMRCSTQEKGYAGAD